MVCSSEKDLVLIMTPLDTCSLHDGCERITGLDCKNGLVIIIDDIDYLYEKMHEYAIYGVATTYGIDVNSNVATTYGINTTSNHINTTSTANSTNHEYKINPIYLPSVLLIAMPCLYNDNASCRMWMSVTYICKRCLLLLEFGGCIRVVNLKDVV